MIPQFRLSIIIVNYNATPHLEQCLRNIFEATKNISSEVIVIDNHSNEFNKAKFQLLFPKVSLVCNSENKGYSHACNQGIKLSTGEYVLLANPDIVIPYNTFDYLLQVLKNDQSIGMLGPKLIRSNGRIDPACTRLFPNRTTILLKTIGLEHAVNWLKRNLFCFPNDFDFTKRHNVECVSGAFMLVRHEAINDVGLMDERFFMYFEDLDWGIRFHKAGWNVSYDPGVQVIHYKRASARQASRLMIKHFFKSHILGYNKHIAGGGYRFIDPYIRLLLILKMYIVIFFDRFGFGPWKENICFPSKADLHSHQAHSVVELSRNIRTIPSPAEYLFPDQESQT